jgi:hypothetical protein
MGGVSFSSKVFLFVVKALRVAMTENASMTCADVEIERFQEALLSIALGVGMSDTDVETIGPAVDSGIRCLFLVYVGCNRASCNCVLSQGHDTRNRKPV